MVLPLSWHENVCSSIFFAVNLSTFLSQVARPLFGIGVRTIVLLDVQLQEDISDFGIKGGFLVDRVIKAVQSLYALWMLCGCYCNFFFLSLGV